MSGLSPPPEACGPRLLLYFAAQGTPPHRAAQSVVRHRWRCTTVGVPGRVASPRSEVKEEARAQPAPGDMSGGGLTPVSACEAAPSHSGPAKGNLEQRSDMALHKPYLDIPGTTIFDAEQSRKGYHLNQFCMSLMKAANRERLLADPRAYLDEWPMTA